MSTSTAVTQKFTTLRKRLDQLGYRQALGVESLPLVEKLFADLIHTTESLKNSQIQASQKQQEKGQIDVHIEPYKSDNARLVRENNDMHQKIIKVREELEASLKSQKLSLRKLEHENADLRFLNNQYVHKIRTTERQLKQKAERILALQEKNLQAVVQTPGGRKKSIPFRRQRMETESTVPDDNLTPRSSQADDSYVADLLKAADDRIAQLTQETKEAKDAREGLEAKIKIFRKQVDTRDTEIERLSHLLDGGRSHDLVALEARNLSNERLISHLNMQVDFLQQKNHEMQRRLDGALSKEREAMSRSLNLDTRNTVLEHELQNVDHMARQLQTDKDLAISSADQQLAEAKVELEKSRRELQELDRQVAEMRKQRNLLMGESTDLKSALEDEQVDRSRLDDVLTKVQEDKRRLAGRVNKLLANEKELVLEIHRLKHKNGVKKKGKTPDPVTSFIQKLEEEKDYWKGEVDVLSKMLKSRPASPTRRAASPTRSNRSTPKSTPTKARSRNASPNASLKKDKTGSPHYESIISALEEERNHYKRELERVKTLSPRPTSPNRSLREKSDSDSLELLKVKRERDEAQAVLEKLERHLSEIQANVKVLSTERDHLNDLYEDAKIEIQRLRQEVVRSPKSPKTSLAAQAVLRRVENERDDALADLRRMTTERDSLRERIKIATETQLSDRARLDQRIEDLETLLQTTTGEREDLQVDNDQRHARIMNLDDQVKILSMKLSDTQNEVIQQKANSNQMRLLAEEAEHGLEEHRRRLTLRETELRASEEKAQRLEDRITDLQRVGHSDQDRIGQLQLTISKLDQEKDDLQHLVDEKSESLGQLNQELLTKESLVRELHSNIDNLESNVQRKDDDIGSRQLEIKSLRRQLESTSEELSETGRSREVALRENRRLQDDLATMTRENQNLNQELHDAVEEQEHLKSQVQDYVLEVKRIEELLAAKEHERTDILDQYRTLSAEAERYESQTHQLESEGSNLRLEVMTRDNELRHLKERAADLEKEIGQHLQAEHSYEVQVSRLTKSLADLESNLRQSENDKLGLVQDLSAVRDLCARLEATKDSLHRQLTSKTLDHEKLQSLVDDMKSETGMLRSQVSQERQSMHNLEDLLQTNREKEFQAQLSSQEKDTEIQLLKDRVALNDSKIDSQNREVTSLRQKCIELESEADRMRRQLTNERFERERAAQELRRHGLAPPVEMSRHSRLSSPTSRARSPTSQRARSPLRSPYRSAMDDDDTMHTL